MPLPVKKVDDNFYVGTLRIPSLGLELPVMEEWSYEGLRVAPCRYAGSAYAGDMVIAAHSYTSHFGRLSSISYGDEVSFADVCGNVFVYKVVSVEELQSTDVGAMVQSEWELTLFTCTFDGSARVAVRCDEIVF
ncbi:MAG: sortase [Eggerthellaceae bacterium]|nr:sortase [Eggerthellaceae bacterium]